MECQECKKLFPLLLAGSLDRIQLGAIENHLTRCKKCRTEFETTKKIWDLMGEIPQPQPSKKMQTDFDILLSDFKGDLITGKNPIREWLSKLGEFWYLQTRPRLALSILLITTGLIIGYLLHRPEQSKISNNRQIDSLLIQVSEMKQLMMLSLLQNPSASQRIQAVSYSYEINSIDLKVIDALFTTLNEDPNVNVRLVTLEALVKFSNEPEVREGLVRSITLQESPLIQSAIADVMVKLQEKSSVQSLRELLSKQDLNPIVRLNIQKSIDELI
jgi:hypothetical protein